MGDVQPVSRNLALALIDASDAGHDPSFYWRGSVVRVHLNRATGSWEDVESEDAAADWLRSKLEASMSEAKRLEYAAFALRNHVEDATGYTYSMDGDEHADDERVQAFRAVWRAFKRAQSEQEAA